MLALSAMVFASCTEEDAPENLTLTQQMLGKWMLTQFDGATVLTNDMMVFTLESDSLGYVSASKVGYNENHTKWANHTACNIVVNDKTITLHGDINKTTSFLAEIYVKSISNNEIKADLEYTVYHNGSALDTISGTTSWTRVSKDYRTDILGTWEGHVTNSEGSVFDDGELHRWKYSDDDTYVYYHLDADSTHWIPQPTELSEYFVDGTLLCTRWKNSGEGEEENREWWEIASIANGVMNWTALRKRDDGTTYTATFQMTKVQ